ncbi:MAG TPA: 3-hydroxyacyl-ACP dehydratase FabZ [Candidatus Eremiobacteraceae bacterium]|jgi:3-hydroxyacyl-[acyl-carrier-protein] dehydratase|nr:3-hydroxyacyl-ACP dehydratase FabZ [Candidatus Eremiobacteraceae bacterium]
MADIDIRRIMETLPHRYPMLLLDRITELEPFKRAAGFKNVTINEPFFQGHFPNNPVMPGIFIVEAMAQLGGTVILEPKAASTSVPYLAGVDKVRFRRPVLPGDRLMMEVRVEWLRKTYGCLQAESRVDGQPVCSALLMFSVVTDSRLFQLDATILDM